MQAQAATERLHAVDQADQPRAGADAGAAGPVVMDLDAQAVLVGGQGEVHDGGTGVLRRVRQHLGNGEVDSQLDRFGQPPLEADVQSDGDGGSARQPLEGRGQPALCEGRGVEAPGDLAQLLERAGEPGAHAGQLGGEVVGSRRHRGCRAAQLQSQ